MDMYVASLYHKRRWSAFLMQKTRLLLINFMSPSISAKLSIKFANNSIKP